MSHHPVDPATESAVRAALAAYVQAALDADWDRFASAFDSEPLCMPAGAPAMSSVEEIRAFYAAFPAMDALALTPDAFEAAGDLVLEVGRYAFSAGSSSDRGKYLHVWRQGPDGAWKLYRNIANSDGGEA